jgi:hypothetical protein
MHLLLFEGPAHFLCELVEKLSHGGIVQIASILRENFAGEDGDRLAMAGISTAGVGIDNFAAGEHPGQKGRVSRRALHHPAMGRPNGLFEIINPP